MSTGTKPHQVSIGDTYRSFESDSLGLSSIQASGRLRQYGPNQLQAAPRKTALQVFLKQFADFMVLVLLVAALVSGLVGDLTDTLVILLIVGLNAVLGFVQERRAEAAMDALKKMSASIATVLRDGAVRTVPSEALVPGDIVLLEAGNLVPADIRLVETFSFRTEEAALTGESLPVEKMTGVLADADLPLGECTNMAFKGTFATYGRAKGMVVATGMQTELGRIASLLQQPDSATPLQKRLTGFGKSLSYVVLLVCAVIFAMGFFRGEGLLEMFLTAVSLAVAAIPEALPAVITIALAIGAKRMVKRNALIRNLPAVETLGSVTYICTDKTGTLTQNQMSVQELFWGTQPVSVGSGTLPTAAGDASALLQAMALSNDVALAESGPPIGDSTELALFRLAHQLGFVRSELLSQMPRVGEIPFDAERKCMTTVHRTTEGLLVLTKGATDLLLQKTRLSEVEKARWEAAANDMASRGFRVIGFAVKMLNSPPSSYSPSELENDLAMLGLAGMMDPPRPEALQAVQECRAAGIVPVMITGDHALTAKAIARQLGILDASEDAVVSGPALAKMSEEELNQTVEHLRVYARVSPEQKLRIVRALQQKGQFVAMTGDGVNDAPALKRADVGVAMGITGTDVSKEAADILLLDDNFATMVGAVRQGRKIYDNIRKFIRFVLTGNTGEILTIFLAPFFGLPIPLLPIHILWVNLVTDGLPGLALASEKAEEDIMQRPPRHPKQSVFAEGLGHHVLWVGLLIALCCLGTQAYALRNGIAHWQTMVFTVLCFSQMGHVLAIRSEKALLFRQGIFSNLPLIGSIGLTFLLHIALLYVPLLNDIFKTQALSLGELSFALGISLVVFHAVELEKWLKARRNYSKKL
jgi:Ca2+-transporting ATPase